MKGGGGGHGGGHHGGHGGHHGGGWHDGGRRGWVGRGWRGGWWGYGPSYVDYVSYSPCDECWSQPPSFVLPCLRYRGCVVDGSVAMMGVGQTTLATSPETQATIASMATAATRTTLGVGVAAVVGVGIVGAGLTWWMKSRRKKRKP